MAAFGVSLAADSITSLWRPTANSKGDRGACARRRQTVAAPMVGGLFSATLLTLLIIPAIYMVWKGVGLKREIRLAFRSVVAK